MLIYDTNIKEIKRNALGYKKVIINAELGENACLNADGDRLVFTKSDEVENHVFVVKRFSPIKAARGYGKNSIHNRVYVIFCGEYMIVELLEGAIIIDNPVDGSPMMVYNSESDLEGADASQVTWMTTEKIRNNIASLNEMSKEYPEDFDYTIEVSAGVGGLTSYKKIDMSDISLGNIQALIAKENSRRATMALKKIYMASSNVKDISEDEIYDDEETEDWDDDEE